EAIFSTAVNADRARSETWVQVASAGSLDLLVNGKLITGAAVSRPKQPKTPRLPKVATEAEEKEKAKTASSLQAVVRPQQNAEPPPLPSPSATPSATASPRSESGSESTATLVEKPTLDAYDISYWIKKGPNKIVAAVRNDQGPASFLASGFMVRKDGSIRGFETNQDWRVGDQQGSQNQRAVETGNN